MTKLKAVRWKTRQRKPQTLYYTSILAKHCHPCQCFNGSSSQCSRRHEDFSEVVRQGYLTESLEICVRYGFDCDLAILVISELQDLLVRRVAR